MAALAGALAILLAIPAAAQATQTLTVEKVGAGAGTVTSSPAGINCGATCSFAFSDSAVVTLTGTPGANSAAVAWSGCETVTVEKKCKVTMSAAKTVKATFNLLKRKLTVSKVGAGAGTVTSSPSGINCGTECSAEYDNGAEVTLTGISGANTETVKWSGCASVDGENHCKVTMTLAKTVTATFNLRKVELKLKKAGLGAGTVSSSPTGIACGSVCNFVFNEGQAITLTGVPGAETQPVKWSGCDSVDAEGKCHLTMIGAKEVAALFNVEGPELTVLKLGNGTGTVTSSPAAIECPSACAVNFHQGQQVILSGAQGLHTQPVKWSGCAEVDAEGKCHVTMSAAREVSASFALEPQWVEYTITLNTTKGNGKGTVTSAPAGIECPGDCSQAYLFKTQLLLIANPAPGSALDRWSLASCGEALFCETSVRSSRTINAVFTAVGKRTLTVSKAGSGQGTVTSSNVAGIDCGATCSAELDTKTKVTLKATPSAGSTFSGWSGEGCSGAKDCHVQMNEARNVTATFAASPSPPAPKCVVPRLVGKTLARARSTLAAAHCSLGKVRKPKGAKLAKLRVRSSTPAAGTTLPSGAGVSLRLAKTRKG